MKVLENCPDDPVEAAWKIEDLTDAQLVGRVGKTLLFYRPSLRKMAQAKAAREREQRRKDAANRSRGRPRRGSDLRVSFLKNQLIFLL